jgi:excisionase family DNA binding protein
MIEISELLTTEEVAKIFKLKEKTVYEWARLGKIPSVKLFTETRFRREAIEDICKNGLHKTVSENNFPKPRAKTRKIIQRRVAPWERKPEKSQD